MASPLAETARYSIFVVEDEALIQMMIVEMLEELGHTVVAKANQIEPAVSLAQSAKFELAVLDVNIAGALITPVAEIIVRRGLPFIFATGYGSAGIPPAFHGRPVLRKLFSPEELAQAIDKVMTA